MTANVISYRGRSAAREIGKRSTFSPSIIDRFSHLVGTAIFHTHSKLESQIEQAGLPKVHPRMPAFIQTVSRDLRLPRHLASIPAA